MPSIRSTIRNGYLSLSSLLLIFFFPLVSIIPVSADSTNTCSPPASSQPGVHWPTGSDASTFTYQCSGPYAGEWTNQYYVFNPSTVTRSPLYAPDYSYDCNAGIWYENEYDFSAATGQYTLNRVQAISPGLPTNCPTTPSAANSTAGSDPNYPPQTSSSPSDSPNDSSSNISGSGPGSNNTNTTNASNNLNSNSSTNATMANTINGVASSGNSLVLGNTTAGDASSGNTQDLANVVNMLQSSSNVLGNGNQVTTFTANIDGNVSGNLLIDPASLSSIQNTAPSSTNTTGTNLNNNLTINNSNNTAINNNVNLAADSGNAAVSNNTSGGNATSGTAETVANVVNTINSAITAGKSFIGTININGDLNGNILLPPNLVNQLLADNVPTVSLTAPNSTNSSSTNVNNNNTINNTNNLGINNNVTSEANSGSANVSNNTSGGNATSGNATTHITAFNLTGSNVIGSNDLLVFVNVTGQWVGLILNAPAGSTAAEFGGGVTNTGPNSTNNNNASVNNNTTVNNTASEQINNNISTTAKSGDALVSDNTKGGNAKSGNADNAINLMNIENSSFNLSGWFGILFINVFGTWNGNFGIYNPNDIASSTSGGNGSMPANGIAVFRFEPRSSSSGSTSNGFMINPVRGVYTSNNGGGNYSDPGVTPAVLAASNSVKASTFSPQLQSTPHGSFGNTALIIGSLVALYIALDAAYTHRQNRRSQQKS